MVDLAGDLVRRVADRLPVGTLEVDGPMGRSTFGEGEPAVRVALHEERALSSLLFHGSVGLAESYVAGWWDADDLTGFIRLLLRNLTTPIRWLDRMGRLIDRPYTRLHQLRPPSRASDRENVRAHYDLPPELFEVMLDDTMLYSCGIFVDEHATLFDAQVAKVDRVCTKLDLRPSDHVLEIGSGWGGFALRAAREFGCRVTTTTVSHEQFLTSKERVAEAGLSDRITVLEEDYRDLAGDYDKLVSLEMIEAVDWRRHDAYFATCGRLLKPEGAMLLQAIVIEERSYQRARQHADFVRRMIFPGGCIPSITAILDSVARKTDLRLFDLEDIGCHYPRTLRHWDERVSAGTGELKTGGIDQGFLRLWHLYLCYCEAAFLERHISDVQMLLTAPGYRPPPGSRTW